MLILPTVFILLVVSELIEMKKPVEDISKVSRPFFKNMILIVFKLGTQRPLYGRKYPVISEVAILDF